MGGHTMLSRRVENGFAMVEVPGAAITLDLILPDVDFVAIGTNDLIQYLLAVDRADPRGSSQYQPLVTQPVIERRRACIESFQQIAAVALDYIAKRGGGAGFGTETTARR